METSVINGKKQYIMFDLDIKHPQIWYWDNVVSCPNELVGFIEDLESVPESYSRISAWSDWTASDNKDLVYGKVKSAKSSLLPFVGDKTNEQKTRYIINSINMGIEMCFDRYLEAHRLDKNNYVIDNEFVNIRRWNAGQSMGPHADGQDGNYALAFTMIEYLNDDYEGGELIFPNHDIKIKPKAGSIVMFPATNEFIHEVSPIVSGSRYSISCSVLTK